MQNVHVFLYDLQCHGRSSSAIQTDMLKLAAWCIYSVSFMALLNHPHILCGIMMLSQLMPTTNSDTKCSWLNRICKDTTTMPSNMSSTIWFNLHLRIQINDKIRYVLRLFEHDTEKCCLFFLLFLPFLFQVGSLLIESTRKFHSGNYTCNPSNSVPATATLHVISSECFFQSFGLFTNSFIYFSLKIF